MFIFASISIDSFGFTSRNFSDLEEFEVVTDALFVYKRLISDARIHPKIMQYEEKEIYLMLPMCLIFGYVTH